MKLLILTGLVIIIVLLALIALMVYAIGDKISQKIKDVDFLYSLGV